MAEHARHDESGHEQRERRVDGSANGAVATASANPIPQRPRRVPAGRTSGPRRFAPDASTLIAASSAAAACVETAAVLVEEQHGEAGDRDLSDEKRPDPAASSQMRRSRNGRATSRELRSRAPAPRA